MPAPNLDFAKRRILAVPGPVHDGRAHAAVPSEELTVTFIFAFGRLVLASVLARAGWDVDCAIGSQTANLTPSAESYCALAKRCLSSHKFLSCWPISSATMRGW